MKKTFKVLSVFLAALVMCAVFCFAASAEDKFTVTVGTLNKTVGVKPGEEIVVPVYFTNNTGVTGYVFNYTYDVNTLEFQQQKTEDNNGSGDYRCIVNDFTIHDKGGSINVVTLYMSKKDYVGDGVITYLFFKVKEDAKDGFTQINVNYKDGNVCNYDCKKLYPEKVNGGVYINVEKTESAPQNTDGKPKGYVPFKTTPQTADKYYSGTISTYDAKNNSGVEIASNTELISSESKIADSTGSAESSEASQMELNDDKPDSIFSLKNIIIICAAVAVVIIGAAVAVYVSTNKKPDETDDGNLEDKGE